MSKSRLVSGRVVKSTKENLDPNRNEFLGLADAEPDLDVPSVDGSILMSDIDGTRYWSKELTVEITGDITGDIYSDDGTKILENGTDGTDAEFTGNVSVETISSNQEDGIITISDDVEFSKDASITGILSVDSISSKTGSITISVDDESNDSIILIPSGTGAIDASDFKIINVATPIDPKDSANKAYVDEVAQGLKVRQSAWVYIDTNLSATYDSDGHEDDWANLTSSVNGAFPTTDGIDTLELNVIGARILVNGQTTPAHNGLYVLDQIGDENTPWILRRCKSCRTSEQIPGSFVFVQRGTLYNDTGWVATVDDPATFVIGVDPIVWVQFSGPGTYRAGSGLELTGVEFSVVESVITDKTQLTSEQVESTDFLLIYDVSTETLKRVTIIDAALQGEQGYTGSQGDLGYTGSAGTDGTSGSDGEPGFTGSQGDIGYTGSQGELGYTGSAGADGIIGVDGFTGSQGDLGYTGSQGEQGYTGSAGTDGVDGFTGSQGDIGYTGSQGEIGYTGSAGADGIIGVDGFTGSQGDTGYTGSRGEAGLEPWIVITSNYSPVNKERLIANSSLGTFIITLPGSPQVGDYIQITDGANFGIIPITVSRNGNTIEGVNNDVLLDLPNSTFEFIYDGATWQVTSTTGPQGYTGSAGSDGTIGSDGYTGSQGEQGYTGSQGDLGYTGSAGTDGTSGTDGVDGFTGSQGDIGYTGSQGEQGLRGYTGSSGISGDGAGIGIANLYQGGTLIVFTGTARWYAPFNLEFFSIVARVVENANDDIEIEIKKNGNLFIEITIPVGEYEVFVSVDENTFLTMNEGDYLTVDILQVGTIVQPGSDLYMQFKYVNI
jgi:hypothetical protein